MLLMLLTSFDDWLSVLRKKLLAQAPELLDVFETYASEAKFGRTFIDSDLKQLQPGAEILEVGAGAMLLSCQLVREGFSVTALEPVGEGFSHFTKLRLFITEQALLTNHAPKLMLLPAEEMNVENAFDFAFSIYVMEHVGDIEMTLRKVNTSLKHKAYYRFITPNYTFPYEPHFNIPTFFNKKITEKILRRKIFNDVRFPDPRGVWASLNWISIGKLKKAARVTQGFEINFNRHVLFNTFQRVLFDEQFSARRSPFIVKFAKIMMTLRINNLLKFIPIQMSPIIDCSVIKK
jgi:2-polyprenyl-3-methyl-5-hydroxy-6-metoxy-1,4-benzoquinol methylase